MKNASGEYTILARTETVSASSSSEESGEEKEPTTTTTFYVDGIDEELQNTSNVGSAASYGYTLSASSEIGNAEDLELADFGLEEPVAVAVCRPGIAGVFHGLLRGMVCPAAAPGVLHRGDFCLDSLGFGVDRAGAGARPSAAGEEQLLCVCRPHGAGGAWQPADSGRMRCPSAVSPGKHRRRGGGLRLCGMFRCRDGHPALRGIGEMRPAAFVNIVRRKMKGCQGGIMYDDSHNHAR